MKISPTAVILELIMLGSVPVFAASLDMHDVTYEPRPDDFVGAQKMALQDRQDRIDAMQIIIDCLNQATTMDDIAVCQRKEKMALMKIRVSYCDSDVAMTNQNVTNPKKNACAKAVSAYGKASAKANTSPPPVKK